MNKEKQSVSLFYEQGCQWYRLEEITLRKLDDLSFLKRNL